MEFGIHRSVISVYDGFLVPFIALGNKTIIGSPDTRSRARCFKLSIYDCAITDTANLCTYTPTALSTENETDVAKRVRNITRMMPSIELV